MQRLHLTQCSPFLILASPLLPGELCYRPLHLSKFLHSPGQAPLFLFPALQLPLLENCNLQASRGLGPGRANGVFTWRLAQ